MGLLCRLYVRMVNKTRATPDNSINIICVLFYILHLFAKWELQNAKYAVKMCFIAQKSQI